MTPMMEFTIWLLGAVADFLGSEPVIYLYGVILFLFICKVIKSFVT